MLEKIERVKQTMLFILLFNILKENIRKTDQLGIFEHGAVACVLSNNNSFAKAELQAKRLIAELDKNPLLKRKLDLFKSKYKHAIVEFNQTFAEPQDMIDQSANNIKNALEAKN